MIGPRKPVKPARPAAAHSLSDASQANAAPATTRPASEMQATGLLVTGQPVNGPLQAEVPHARPVQLAAPPVAYIPAARSLRWSPSDETQLPSEFTRSVIDGSPPWLVSLVFHLVLMILLGLATLPSLVEEMIDIEVSYAEETGEQLDSTSMVLESLEPTFDGQPLTLSQDLTNESIDPFAALPEIESLLPGFVETTSIAAPSIGIALSGREAGMRRVLLAKYGGTHSTEAAVSRGLQWLKRNQQRDGGWSLKGPYSNGTEGRAENRCAATAMALLALQGAGNTHVSGPYQAEVEHGIAALLRMQSKDGDFASATGGNHRLYSHAQAAIAICELLGMTQDEQLRKPAQRAINYAVSAQAPEGGWRYRPGEDSDTSVTGWFVIALQSALMAQLDVPKETRSDVTRFLDSVQEANGTRYYYHPIRRTSPTPAMTAEALLCRQYLGWKRDDTRLIAGVEYLLRNPINFGRRNHDVYYWYYAAQVTHHMEGDYWDKWNAVMREEVPKHQVLAGREQGSWDPHEDRRGSQGGRLYVTCLCLYMLEVYYRHLPIYQYRTAVD